MPDDRGWLLDTNILLRMSKQADPHYQLLQKTLGLLVNRGCRLYYTTQTFGEFWNVSTRPLKHNCLGMSVTEVERFARAIEKQLRFLPDGMEVHNRWRELLVVHEVKGVQVHDARLAASMYVHGISNLLTFNVRDFQRFKDLSVVHPADLFPAAPPPQS